MKRSSPILVVSASLIISDLLTLLVSPYIINSIFSELVSGKNINDWYQLHWLISICCVSWYGMRLRHYFYRKTYWLELKETLRTIIIFAVFEIAIIAFTDWHLSRTKWAISWILIIVTLPWMRIITKIFLNNIGVWQRDTIIIGAGNNAQEAYKAISSEKNLGFNTKKFIGTHEKCFESINGIEVIHKLPIDIIKNINKDMQFIIAVESNERDLRDVWLQQLMINGFRYVSVIPTLRGMPLDSTDMSFIYSNEVMIFRVHQNLAKWSSKFVKRTFDIFASLIIIIVISPLFFIISRKVKEDGGPAIYGHERVGKDGTLFKCLKFRSMSVKSEELLNELLDKDPRAKAEWSETFKLKNDPRITNIGHFLRRTSLDELPQLFNVLKGEMSLVGPRPIIHEELVRYREQVEYYLISKPGMTGLWQVSGRSDVDYETRVYLDAWYVKNWSLWNDLVIIIKTIKVVLRNKGAY